MGSWTLEPLIVARWVPNILALITSHEANRCHQPIPPQKKVLSCNAREALVNFMDCRKHCCHWPWGIKKATVSGALGLSFKDFPLYCVWSTHLIKVCSICSYKFQCGAWRVHDFQGNVGCSPVMAFLSLCWMVGTSSSLIFHQHTRKAWPEKLTLVAKIPWVVTTPRDPSGLK